MVVVTAPAGPTHELPGTRFTALVSPSRGATDSAVWRVAIDPNIPATPHSVTREEIFVITAGEARVRVGGDTVTARAGDAVVIPPGMEFELRAAGSVPVEALVVLPVGGQAQLPGGEPFTPPWAE